MNLSENDIDLNVGKYLLQIAENTKTIFPVLIENISSMSGEKVEFENQDGAVYEFTLASAAMDLNSVASLFPDDVSVKIIEKVNDYFDAQSPKSSRQIFEYLDWFKRCVSQNMNFIEGYGELLCRIWGFEDTEYNFSEGKIKTANPLICMMVGEAIVKTSVGFWKHVKDEQK